VSLRVFHLKGADRVLEDHEDYAADDVITFMGKEFTKKEIRLANRNARAALLKFLPAQRAELQRSEQRSEMEEKFNAAIPLEIPELADPETPMAKQFNAMLTDPLVAEVKRLVPEIAPQMGYLLAHAARSMASKSKPLTTTAKAAPGTPPRPKVSGSPVGAAAAKTGGNPDKKREEQKSARYEQTGSIEDLVAARAARHSRTR